MYFEGEILTSKCLLYLLHITTPYKGREYSGLLTKDFKT